MVRGVKGGTPKIFEKSLSENERKHVYETKKMFCRGEEGEGTLHSLQTYKT